MGMSLNFFTPSGRRRRALNRPKGVTRPARLREPIGLPHRRRVSVAEWQALKTWRLHLSWLCLDRARDEISSLATVWTV